MRIQRNDNSNRRPGKVLILFVIMLSALIGMVGLVVDSGMMMAAHRKVQNAADAAAIAAARELFYGNTVANARTVATTFVQNYNGMANATVTVNSPYDYSPGTGTSSRYVEVIVTRPHTTYFIQAIGVSSSQQVQARAVAGYEAVASGEGAIVLDPTAAPGLDITGGSSLRVNGAVIVNSQGGGVDQYGQTVSGSQYALKATNNSNAQASLFLVSGGVNDINNFTNIDPSGPNPLFCRAPIGPDPLRDLPVPTNSNVNGISDWTKQPPMTFSQGDPPKTLSPGIYSDININNATVTFNPGVYIISPQDNKPGGLRINGSSNVTGNGVMFYLTGSNYLDQSPGHWDVLDDAQNALDGPLPPNPGTIPSPPDPNFSKVRFATLDINATGGTVRLNGLNDPSSVFNNILFFQRRRASAATNPAQKTGAQIQGNAGNEVFIGGTIYAKWANFKVSGFGRYDAQFVVGSMALSGGGTVTILSTGRSFGRANQVFLVE